MRFRFPCDALSTESDARVDRQRTESEAGHHQLVHAQPFDDDASAAIHPRRQRQQAEILRLLAAQQLHRELTSPMSTSPSSPTTTASGAASRRP